VALPAFVCQHAAAAERQPCSSRSISPARQVHSSKPAAAGLLLWAHAGQRDGETNTRTDNVLSNSPYYVGSVSSFLTAHTHPFNGPLSRTARVGQYQKGKTNLDFTEARDSEWQWHQLDQSAPRSRQKTTPAPHRSVFYRPNALPAAQPTASKPLKATFLTAHKHIIGYSVP